MTNTLTSNETAMLKAFIDEGKDNCGSKSIEAMIGDNMTWMSATDLCAALGWNKQKVGGTMAALLEKGLIADSGQSAREANDSDWFASDEGIKQGFNL